MYDTSNMLTDPLIYQNNAVNMLFDHGFNGPNGRTDGRGCAEGRRSPRAAEHTGCASKGTLAQCGQRTL